MGVAAAAVAGAAIGAGATIYAANKQEKQAKKGLKRQDALAAQQLARQEQVGQQVGAEAQLAREQLRSAETARGLVLGQLGAPGTYRPTRAGQGEFAIDLGQPRGLGGLTRPGTIPQGLYGTREIDAGVGPDGKPITVKGEVADPFETATNITSQPQFAAVSGLVNDAIQLAAREGPVWDQLNQSVVGGVYESAAQLQRQMMNDISRAVARGGTARRAGVALAQKFQAQEQINRQRTQQLWQSRVQLEDYRNRTIQNNLSYANQWVNNQAGIRDTFVSTLANLRTMWSQTMPAIAIPAGTAVLATQSQSNQMTTNALMAATATKTQAIIGATESITGALMTVGSNSSTNTTGSQGASI